MSATTRSPHLFDGLAGWSGRAAQPDAALAEAEKPSAPAARALRVLMVASEGPPTRSGVARTVSRVKGGLEARGHSVDVVASPAVPRLVVGEVRLSGLLFTLPSLLRRVRDYDVVHLHGEAPSVSEVFLLAWRRLMHAKGKDALPPLVYTHHCDVEVGRPFNALYNAFHHRLSGAADEIVTTTRGYAARLGAEEHTSVIPLGVDLPRFGGERPKDQQFTVLFVGQFRPYKGVRVLLQAMSQVAGARLLVVGRGPEERQYRALADELGLDAEFHVRASDGGLAELYRRAHAVVLPSVTRAEAFGLVLLEGMAAGCIPVASDLPGVREVLGRAGFTFPVGSAVELAHVLRTLRDDPAAVETFGIMARERAAEFTWERTIAEYERLLLDLVETRALSSAVTGSLGTVGQRGDNPLHTFVQHIARNLGTERAEVLLDGPMGGGALHGIASSLCTEAPHDATVPLPPDDPCGDSVMGSIVALARYSYDTGEGVLLAPRPLPHQQDGAKSALCIAPVVVDRKAIGALVALRLHPFEQRDLDSLSRLARHVAPILHSLDASGNALWPSDALLSNQMSPTSQTNVHAPLETASPSSAPPPPSLPRKSPTPPIPATTRRRAA